MIVAIGEGEQLLAGRGNERGEGDRGGLTGLERDPHAECEDWVEHGTGGTAQRSVLLERNGIARSAAAPEESRAIGLESHRTYSVTAGSDHMGAPESSFLRRARAAGCGQRRTPRMPLGLDEQVSEGGVGAISVRRSEYDLAIARELDL